jgi:hypothetical protein
VGGDQASGSPLAPCIVVSSQLQRRHLVAVVRMGVWQCGQRHRAETQVMQTPIQIVVDAALFFRFAFLILFHLTSSSFCALIDLNRTLFR